MYPLAHESVATLLWSLAAEKSKVLGPKTVGGAEQVFTNQVKINEHGYMHLQGRPTTLFLNHNVDYIMLFHIHIFLFLCI